MTVQKNVADNLKCHWIAVLTCMALGYVSSGTELEFNATTVGPTENNTSTITSQTVNFTLQSNTTAPRINTTTSPTANTTTRVTSTTESQFIPNTTQSSPVLTTFMSLNTTAAVTKEVKSLNVSSPETSQQIPGASSSQIESEQTKTIMRTFMTSTRSVHSSELIAISSTEVAQEATSELEQMRMISPYNTVSEVITSSVTSSIPNIITHVTKSISLSSETFGTTSEVQRDMDALSSIIGVNQTSLESSTISNTFSSSLAQTFTYLTKDWNVYSTASEPQVVSNMYLSLIGPFESTHEIISATPLVLSPVEDISSSSLQSSLPVTSSSLYAFSSQEMFSSLQGVVSSHVEQSYSDAIEAKIVSSQSEAFASISQVSATSSFPQIFLQSSVADTPVEQSTLSEFFPLRPSSTTVESSLASVTTSLFTQDVKPLTSSPLPTLRSQVPSASPFIATASSEIISEDYLVPTSPVPDLPTSVHVESTTFTTTPKLPSLPISNSTVTSTTVASVNRSRHHLTSTNISFEIEFIGVCDPLVQRKIVLEEFWGYLVVAVSTMLRVDKMKIKPKDIACNPIRITFTILDITHPNTTHALTDFVASGKFTFKLPVLLEDTESKFTYEATSVKIVPSTYDINGGVDTYEMGLSEVDIIVIISACCVSVILICVGCCICLREYYLRKRSRSFDLSDIVNFNLKLEDYTLTKIPRAKPFYSDGSVKMQSFTRKNGHQAKALLEQDEFSADDTTNENGNLIKELQVRMNQHSDGIVIGITKTNTSSTNQQSPAMSPCELKDQSKEILYEHNASPTHCMDNPIYYADDDRFIKV